MKTLSNDGAVLHDMPPVEHDRDESGTYHGHLSPVFAIPLDEPYDIGHGFKCERAVAHGFSLYLLHRHGFPEEAS